MGTDPHSAKALNLRHSLFQIHIYQGLKSNQPLSPTAVKHKGTGMVPVPSFAGRLKLWHHPSQNQQAQWFKRGSLCPLMR
ncbi:hypothetical protein CEF21_01435 [Bacillus sp. FJAT-42376]|nr:hypothetical protein CEF21_01435 [Bacillus sp. FJAT-42376]